VVAHRGGTGIRLSRCLGHQSGDHRRRPAAAPDDPALPGQSVRRDGVRQRLCLKAHLFGAAREPAEV